MGSLGNLWSQVVDPGCNKTELSFNFNYILLVKVKPDISFRNTGKKVQSV